MWCLLCIICRTGLFDRLCVSHVQVGYSQSLSPVSSPHGPAPIPRPFQAFCGLLPIQRGKINDDGPYEAEQHPHWWRSPAEWALLVVVERYLISCHSFLLLGGPAGNGPTALPPRTSLSLPRSYNACHVPHLLPPLCLCCKKDCARCVCVCVRLLLLVDSAVLLSTIFLICSPSISAASYRVLQ